jgi:hypothetical protein
MKTLRMLSLLGALTLSAAVTGCWTDDDDDQVATPPPTTGPGTVPDSAGVSSASFVSYLMGLASDETSEPVLIPTGLAVPADETADVKPLT